MTQNGDIAAIREDVSHIARGCQSSRSHNPEVYQHSIDAALDRLAALFADAEKALNCAHNHFRSDAFERDPWDYVDYEGKTWNRCRACGLLELWEGGMFVRAALSAGRGEHG